MFENTLRQFMISVNLLFIYVRYQELRSETTYIGFFDAVSWAAAVFRRRSATALREALCVFIPVRQEGIGSEPHRLPPADFGGPRPAREIKLQEASLPASHVWS